MKVAKSQKKAKKKKPNLFLYYTQCSYIFVLQVSMVKTHILGV